MKDNEPGRTLQDRQALVENILRAAGHPELTQEGTGRNWRIVTPGWDVFTFQGAVRVSWWSECTLNPDPDVYQQDYSILASLRPALEAAGLAVTQPDPSVLEV